MVYPKRSRASLIFGDAGWVFGLFLLGGAATGVPALFMLGHAAQLYSQGVPVQGKVDQLWQTQESCGKDNLDSCNRYHVHYSFDAGGPLHEDTASVGAEFYASLQAGGAIAVRYVRGNPDINEVEGGWSAFGGVLLLLFSLVFTAVAAVAIWTRVRTVLRGERLRDTGLARQATVTGQARTNITVNNRQLWRITWRDDSGAEGQSRGRALPDLPATGTVITIYADPAAAVPAVWDGDFGTR